MQPFICYTCGVEYAESEAPPQRCLICDDERQYVGWNGQRWTTQAELIGGGRRNELRRVEPDLYSIGLEPSFAIGQRALLIVTPEGNVLFDCLSLLDDSTQQAIASLGGIQHICLSHPHFYGAMATWSRAFDGAAIHVPIADRDFVTRPDKAIQWWDGQPLNLVTGVTLVQTGGHFPGSAVVHWSAGAEGRGVLLVGDSIAVVPDRRYVSFMFSYPNLIPTSAATVRAIVAAVEPLDFDRIYGGWWQRDVMSAAKDAVHRSAERYVRMIEPPAS